MEGDLMDWGIISSLGNLKLAIDFIQDFCG